MSKKKFIGSSNPTPFNPDKLETYYKVHNLNYNNNYQPVSSTTNFKTIVDNKPDTSSFSIQAITKGGNKNKKGGTTTNINRPLDMNRISTYFNNSKLGNDSFYTPISSTGAFINIVTGNNQGSSFALQKGGLDNIINKNFKKFKKGGEYINHLDTGLKDIYNIGDLTFSKFPKSGLIDHQLDSYGSS